MIYFLSIPCTFCNVQANRAYRVTYTILLSKIMEVLQEKTLGMQGYGSQMTHCVLVKQHWTGVAFLTTLSKITPSCGRFSLLPSLHSFLIYFSVFVVLFIFYWSRYYLCILITPLPSKAPTQALSSLVSVSIG